MQSFFVSIFKSCYCGNLCIAILISLFIHISIIFILILTIINVALYICIPGTGLWTYVSAVHRCLLTPCPAAIYHGICPLLPNDVVSMVTTCSQSMCTIVFGIGMYMTIHFKIFINSLLYQICCKIKKRSIYIYIYIYVCVCVCIVVPLVCNPPLRWFWREIRGTNNTNMLTNSLNILFSM